MAERTVTGSPARPDPVKLFVSQPMAGRTEAEIMDQRARAVEYAKFYSYGITRYLLEGTRVEVIDSYIPEGADSDKPLWYLGASLQKLSEADVAYFAAGWQDSRGCKIERKCAIEYGIPTICAP